MLHRVLRSLDGAESASAVSVGKEVNAESLDFSQGVNVRDRGFRFIIPIPNLGTENQTYNFEKRGQPITKVGVVFANPTDGIPQVVVGNGSGVFIVGIKSDDGKGPERAKQVADLVLKHGGATTLTTGDKISALVADLKSAGFNDVYDSEDSKIKKGLTGVSGLSAVTDSARLEGYYEKSGTTFGKAVFVAGPVKVNIDRRLGDADYPRGCFVVQILDSSGDPTKTKVRSIAPEAMDYCWVQKESGAPVVQTQCPQY